MITITNVKGLGKSNTRVITPNNTYLIDRKKELKRTEVSNNCYIEWETNSKGQIIGLVELFFSKTLVNGRMQERVINKVGKYQNLI